jgi:glycosyltransferase involved in cell wall biosynthesis
MSRLVLVHSSNEMYGSDRMVIEVLATLPERLRASSEVWLPADSPNSVHTLEPRLSAAGHTVIFRDLPILRRSRMGLRGLLGLVVDSFRTLIAFTRERPDVVYCATSATLVVAVIAKFVGVRRIIFHNQEIWEDGLQAKILRLLASAASDIVAISEASRASLGERLSSRAVTIPNGVPDICSDGLPQAVADRSGPLTFLMASRWNDWKGHATLLDAWTTAPAGSRLLIAGGPPLNGEAVEVRRLVSVLPNRDSVSVLGEVSDLAQLIAMSDVVVVPSDKPEPFGLIAIEAFACGRAVIASDAGGLADIVDHSETGLLYPLRDTASLSRALGVTREAAGKMGLNAREEFARTYSAARFAERFSSVWSR